MHRLAIRVRNNGWRISSVNIMVVRDRETYLFQVSLVLRFTGRIPGMLYRGKEEEARSSDKWKATQCEVLFSGHAILLRK